MYERTVRPMFAWFVFWLFIFIQSWFVYPTPWKYDHLGKIPVRFNRFTGSMQYLSLQGWQEQLPPLAPPSFGGPQGAD